VLNQAVRLEEDGATEFKEVTSHNPVSTITDTAEDYAVAFLNATGGRILWGIRDKDRCVVGVTLNAEARDRIRKGLANRLHNIQPAIDPTQYSLQFYPITGESAPGELVVVELFINGGTSTHPFYNHKGELHVRINGVKQKLTGPRLTAWIQQRLKAASHPTSVDNPKLCALACRIQRVFDEHGLEPAHLARFIQMRKAPFSIALTDIQTDAALLRWLDESKVDWISKTFLVRREWIDGEDNRIHEEYCFDKQPKEFFAVVSHHADALVFDEVHDSPEAYFLRWGVGKEWERKGEGCVFVVLAIPMARFSNERTIYKYISDLEPYSWTNYARTNIQLRAWARLLTVNKGFFCFGREIPYDVGEQLASNAIFMREVIEKHCKRTRDDWQPEDHALHPEESMAAKDTDTTPAVIEFLRMNNLPWEKTQPFGSRH